MTANASSETIRMSRKRPVRALKPDPREPSRIAEEKDTFDACNAGASPKASPVASAIITAKMSTGQSTWRALIRGMLAGRKRAIIPRVLTAVTTPTTAPMTDKSIDSVIIWRIMRPRPAPKASRTATSCCRPEARANSRLAMFNDTIRTMRITAPITTSSMGRTLPTRASCSG